MFYDVIVIAILLISIIVGYKRGAAKMVISLFGCFLSFAVAVMLGDFLTEILYDSYLKQAIIDGVSTQASADSVVEYTTATLPTFVSFAVMFTKYDCQGVLSDCAENFPDAVASVFEEALRPIVMSVLSFVLVFFCFIIIHFILKRVLAKVLNFVFNFPIIKGLNKALGAVISLLSGLLIVSFIAFLLNLVMPYTSEIPYFMSESTIYNSYIFYHFYSGNIYNVLISIF